MTQNNFIMEPARELPVIAAVDICVLGGSCTGVFAALRAARLGASVAIVEKMNGFGGVATNGMVNIWHSVYDTVGKKQIIGGLSLETAERLKKRGALNYYQNNPSRWCDFNSEELKLELDAMVLEAGVRPFLHTLYCAPLLAADNRVEAVVVENKNGRGAIRASVFIDATGDGDLAAHLGLPYTVSEHLQPPTVCARVRNFRVPGLDYRSLYRERHQEFGLELDAGWSGAVPGLPGTSMFAETHVFGANCADAEQLTAAEMKGRRQLRACLDMVRKYGGPEAQKIAIEAIASYIGIRESRRFTTDYQVTEEDFLEGRSFPDTVARGSYRLDTHFPTGGGFVFKYLDGTMEICDAAGKRRDRWREPRPLDPTFYQIPYRVMVSRKLPNVILAGRMVGAESGAFGALRVMINLNQLGEAAGAAAVIAKRDNLETAAVPPDELRNMLIEGGSILD